MVLYILNMGIMFNKFVLEKLNENEKRISSYKSQYQNGHLCQSYYLIELIFSSNSSIFPFNLYEDSVIFII